MSAAPKSLTTEETYYKVLDALRMMHFLNWDLETSLRADRGRTDKFGTITLMFQPDGIDATLWLSDRIWNTLKDLSEVLGERLSAEIEAENEAEAKAAA